MGCLSPSPDKTDFDLALMELTELCTLDLLDVREIAPAPGEAEPGTVLSSVGRAFCCLGDAMPMETSAVPSVARNLTDV